MKPAANPTIELANVTGDINRLQEEIAKTEFQMDKAISAETGADEVFEIRIKLTALRAALGQRRNYQSFLTSELNEEKQQRKNQNELTRG